MDARAVILDAPERLSLRALRLTDCGADDLVVEARYSGISTGTEKLLFTGEMPPFPGMGYPLVPGYETVGRVIEAGANVKARIGDWVFVPGASCYEGARGLFGGTAERLVVPASRVIAVPESLGADGCLLVLAATAHHALAGGDLPELVVGHGVLGRLMARMTVALGGTAPTVWERESARMSGADGYAVTRAEDDPRDDYGVIHDVSGSNEVLDTLVGRLAKGGEICLAGFYSGRIDFAFPPAFRAEARLRIAAEFGPQDMAAVSAMIGDGRLSLGGLVSDVAPAREASDAYARAFNDPDCLKMVLDWKDAA